ncbi:MAG: enoyl-CoA hydratase-related protein [Candidatus Kapabacteria bacterium]|jgi:methylglutaconyl-CoA hydratase|nr:enoyl-CoA hydratase-related protein [Candidatus Kapabacteria bacterium]
MSLVQTSIDGVIGTIAMNRPEKRNALSADMVAQLMQAVQSMQLHADVRAIVLRGEGSAFCAGADLSYLQDISTNSVLENLADSTALMQLMQAMVECPKPIIGMVHGPAIAGGCGLATVCDLVVAGREKARFGYSEVKIGFIPAIVMVYLLRKVGDTQARRLVLTADVIGAEEALALGLISHVADDADLVAATYALAERIAANSASALALSKGMLSSLHGMSMDAGLRYAASMNALARQTDDCKEGISRFLHSSKG